MHMKPITAHPWNRFHIHWIASKSMDKLNAMILFWE